MPELKMSYVNTHDPQNPVQEELVMGMLFEKALREAPDGEVVCLETGERRPRSEILMKADQYAKGLIALGLEPGVDTLTVIGCSSIESLSLFAACAIVGFGYGHPYIYHPYDASIERVLPLVRSKVVVVGEGEGGQTFSALVKFFEADAPVPKSEKLSFVERVFYDDTWNGRNPTERCVEPLQTLIRLGESISDSQLQQYKEAVRPQWVMQHLFTSGSTGMPKCVIHMNGALSNDIVLLTVKVQAVLGLCPNVGDVAGYSALAAFLSGQVSKLVFTPELNESRSMEGDGETCARAIIDEKVDCLGLPGVLNELVMGSLQKIGAKFPPLKYTLQGFQIISRGTFEHCQQVLGGMSWNCYGMSEADIIGWSSFGEDENSTESRLGGRLFLKPNSEMRLVDEDEKIVQIGQEGEIQLKTYSLFKEYRGQPEKTRKAFTDDGFFRTGDVGVMSPDGSFAIKGRVTDGMRFKVLGEVIYPGPIEQQMSQHPNIAEISVVGGLFNDFIGDEITYCIRLKDKTVTIAEDEFIELCSNETTKPFRVIYFDKLPLTANCRKVSKKLLREQVRTMLAEDDDLGKMSWYKELEDQLTQPNV